MFDYVSFLTEALSNGLLIGVCMPLSAWPDFKYSGHETIHFGTRRFLCLGMYTAVLLNVLWVGIHILSLLVAIPLGFIFGASLPAYSCWRDWWNAPPESTLLVDSGLR